MARPKNRSETRQLTVSLPSQTHDYLVVLATLGKLGPSEADVAAHILVREIDNLMTIDYHEIKAPKL